MSYHLIVDGEPAGDVASTRGMADLRRWAEERGEELAHLVEHGWSQEPRALESQLSQALLEDPPELDSVRSTAQALLEKVKGSKETVVISDGA